MRNAKEIPDKIRRAPGVNAPERSLFVSRGCGWACESVDRDEVLRKQRTQTPSSLDRPGARLERCRESQQPVALPTFRGDS